MSSKVKISDRMQALIKKTIEVDTAAKQKWDTEMMARIWQCAKDAAAQGQFTCNLSIASAYPHEDLIRLSAIAREAGFTVRCENPVLFLTWDESAFIVPPGIRALLTKTQEVQKQIGEVASKVIWEHAEKASKNGVYVVDVPVTKDDYDVYERVAKSEGFKIKYKPPSKTYLHITWDPRF